MWSTSASTSAPPAIAVAGVDDLALPRRDASGHKWSAGLDGVRRIHRHARRAVARGSGRRARRRRHGRVRGAGHAGGRVVLRYRDRRPSTSDDERRSPRRGSGAARAQGTGSVPRARRSVRAWVATIAPRPRLAGSSRRRRFRSSWTPTRSTRSAVDASPLRVRHAAGLPPAILTPHAAEYERLAGHGVGADRIEAARELADAPARDRRAEGAGHRGRAARRPGTRQPHRRPRARDRGHRRRPHRHHRRPSGERHRARRTRR